MIETTTTPVDMTAATMTTPPAEGANPAARMDFPPRLSFYHASPRGSGSAVAFEIDPATSSRDGAVYLQIAAQSGTGAPAGGGQARRNASFDWRNKITVKFGFAEVADIMMVLCGMSPAVGRNGKGGFYHDTATAATTIDFRRSDDPSRPGFFLGITRVPKDNPEGKANMVFVFGPGEALGLRLALEHSMGLLAFGIPCARDRFARQ